MLILLKCALPNSEFCSSSKLIFSYVVSYYTLFLAKDEMYINWWCKATGNWIVIYDTVSQQLRSHNLLLRMRSTFLEDVGHLTAVLQYITVQQQLCIPKWWCNIRVMRARSLTLTSAPALGEGWAEYMPSSEVIEGHRETTGKEMPI